MPDGVNAPNQRHAVRDEDLPWADDVAWILTQTHGRILGQFPVINEPLIETL